MFQGFCCGQVLSDSTVKHPRPTNPRPATLGQPAGTKNHIEIPPMTSIMVRASHFTLLEIQRLASQSFSIGPNNSLSSSQPCIRGDDLAKQAAASSTNGVVGNSGNTTPIAASNRNNRPKIIQRYKTYYRRRVKKGVEFTASFMSHISLNIRWALSHQVTFSSIVSVTDCHAGK